MTSPKAITIGTTADKQPITLDVDRLIASRLLITDAGAALAQPTAGTSLDDWLSKLTGVEADVLKTIAAAWPERMTRQMVSDKSGRSVTSSSFQAAFSALRDLQLIEGAQDFAITESLAEAPR